MQVMQATVKMLRIYICYNLLYLHENSSSNKFMEKHGIKAIVSNWWNPKQFN